MDNHCENAYSGASVQRGLFSGGCCPQLHQCFPSLTVSCACLSAKDWPTFCSSQSWQKRTSQNAVTFLRMRPSSPQGHFQMLDDVLSMPSIEIYPQLILTNNGSAKLIHLCKYLKTCTMCRISTTLPLSYTFLASDQNNFCILMKQEFSVSAVHRQVKSLHHQILVSLEKSLGLDKIKKHQQLGKNSDAFWGASGKAES